MFSHGFSVDSSCLLNPDAPDIIVGRAIWQQRN
jgi:hypothetical protein